MAALPIVDIIKRNLIPHLNPFCAEGRAEAIIADLDAAANAEAEATPIQRGDIVRVRDGIAFWGGCLLEVDEVRSDRIACVMREAGGGKLIVHLDVYEVERTRGRVPAAEVRS